jgi:transposase InsO family protein
MGHFGVNKTIRKLSKYFFWLNFNDSIFQFIKHCDVCQRTKKLKRKNKAALKSIFSNYPFQLIHLDIVGPLTCTKNGNRYILVIVDHFSKYVVATAVKDFTAETTAKILIDQIICKFGTPNSICSDLGVNFESKLFKHLCELLRIKKLKSTAYHPQTNGAVERMNKTLKQLIKNFVNCHHNDWDEYINQLSCAINTSTNESTKHTPHEIVFGKEFVFPQNVQFKQSPKELDNHLID